MVNQPIPLTNHDWESRKTEKKQGIATEDGTSSHLIAPSCNGILLRSACQVMIEWYILYNISKLCMYIYNVFMYK